MPDAQVILLEVQTESAVVDEGKLTDIVTDLIETSTLVIEDPDLALIEVGIQGPAGPAGAGSTAYAQRVDLANDFVFYKGEAAPGSADSAPAWRISRIVLTDDAATTTWANAGAFTGVWLDRLTYTYE